MANLFGKNRLREIAQRIDTNDIREYIDIVQTWQSDYHHGTLKNDKETSREQQYNRDIFLHILGYAEKPAVPFSFEPKATTEKGQLPDAVISHTDAGKNETNIAAVVELKGAGIDLDRPQRREGNMSPVQQAFKYKTQYRNCPFVVVSNFWEFRLYRDNLLDYEAWTLDDLVDPTDDYLLFKTWYALLSRDSFTSSKGSSRTEQLLSDIRIDQEEIGKKFYKVYKQARLELLRDIYANNSHVRSSIDIGIEKSQKIIDRIVFACFAEDRGLLPDNILAKVVRSADGSVFGGSLWNTLKDFFEAIDRGSDKLEIPEGYNGGLFARDETLNNLRINDEPLRAVLELSTYNFSEDLSVTILGHIFEQSISDLEEIKSKVNESQNLENLTQNRRKKDGIFYTPDYIVRYIVDNSLGAYLREHEEKFKDEFGLRGDIADKTYEKRERQAYAKYQDFLHGVKVLDPACGSGAFLVYVFDYLLAENKRVGDILGNDLFSSDAYIRDILRNNIYGVDLNEESVEITKLSLWLKSAQKGKKLTTLDGNIRCGNSLIDDPNIAGNKAFDWNKQFAEIMGSGGFDVVVGNPPYVSVELMKDIEKSYYRSKYATFYKRSDMFALFIEIATERLRENGYWSFIMPSVFLTNLSYSKARDFLIDHSYLHTVCYTGGKVFADATVDTTILVAKKTNNREISLQNAVDFNDISTRIVPNNYFSRLGNVISIGESGSSSITDKIFKSEFSTLDEKFTIFQGIVTGNNEAFIFDNHQDAIDKGIEAELLHPFCHGRDIEKWHVRSTDRRILYIDPSCDIEKFPGTKLWLEQYREILSTRRECVRGVIPWYALQWPRRKSDLDTNQKIFLQRTRNEQLKTRIVATIDSHTTYVAESIIVIIPKLDISAGTLLPLLNSKLFNYLFSTKFLNLSIKADYLKKVRLPVITAGTADILERLSFSMLSASDKCAVNSNMIQKILMHEYGLDKWSTKLVRWWTLDFTDFVNALKVKLSLQQKDELLQLFDKYRVECLSLDQQIHDTDRAIDQLVYKLYDLTPEEIAIVEQSSK